MKLYFYTNKNVLFDFLERSTIAPNNVIKDIKGYWTVSTSSDDFLFVTHKKLDRKTRVRGIAEPELVYPVTLEISDPQEDDRNVILVMKDNDAIEYLEGKLSEYDPDTCIGAYVLGEIPFSRVEKIYFDTQEDMDTFSRPSPDYWYPKDKYALLPDGFTEELNFTPNEKQMVDATGVDTASVIRGIRKREKERAGLLNFIDGTSNWQHDKYIFNVDDRMLQLFGLKAEDIATALPHYSEVSNKDNVETLMLFYKADEPSDDINQDIYNIIYKTFLHAEYNTKKAPEIINDLLNAICDGIDFLCQKPQEANFIRNCIVDIEKLISDQSEKDPETIMSGFPEPIDVLKALLLTVKNPNNYADFLTSLDAYHADFLTRRRSKVLWGVLNGLYGVPGEGFNKDNQKLWEFIEAYVEANNQEPKPSFSVKLPSPTLEGNRIFGIELQEERIVTAGEIREIILSTPREKLAKTFYAKLYEAATEECGSKKKAENKGYAHTIASIDIPEIKKGSELDSKIRKILEQLLKDCKEPVPNEEKLFKDYVKDEKKFQYVFQRDPEYWKRSFKITSEKKNA